MKIGKDRRAKVEAEERRRGEERIRDGGKG